VQTCALPIYFNKLCLVMDRARKQELQSENLEEVFLPLRDAPYLDYFLSCKIYVAFEDGILAGLIGFRPGSLNFIYVDPTHQNKGIATELIKKALVRSEEHTSELQSRFDLVCRLLLRRSP